MRFMFIALAVLASCGQTESNTQPIQVQGKSDSETKQKTTLAAGQPRFLMVKVPVDASGNEIISSAESKEVADGEISTAEAAQAAFASSKSSVTVADELDRSTSTESWGRSWYWNRQTPWYPGRALGRGTWWGHNPYLYYNNVSFAYNYGNFYYCNGFNYHYWYY